jgi:ubiquinone/menaquinone biosynthesis C-methylase UbiE
MVETVQYKDESFDFITYGSVFEHIYHPAQALEKGLKWLKPNGVIHIEVPSSKYLVTKLFNYYFKAIGTSYVSQISPMHPPFHLYEFGLESFERLGKKIGYRVEHHHIDVCEIFLIPKLFHAPLRKYMERTKTGMQLTVYLRRT